MCPAPPSRMTRNRLAIRRAMEFREDRWYFSATAIALARTLLDAVRRNVRGRTLDAGAGDLHYRKLLAEMSERYVSLDIERRADCGLDCQGSVLQVPFADASFDSVFCSQVLEHVPHPWTALAEYRRVLKPGGCLVGSVPHLSREHEAPHDYFRYTRYGMASLLRDAGFVDIQVTPTGGFLNFNGHIVSTILLSGTWHLPVVRDIVWALNRWASLAVFHLDSKLDKQRLFATDFVFVAKCPNKWGASPPATFADANAASPHGGEGPPTAGKAGGHPRRRAPAARGAITTIAP